MKFLTVLLLLIDLLFSQKLSLVAVTEDTYLNFKETEKNSEAIYIDETSLLAWQNSIALISFRKKSNADNYCKRLRLGELSWSLPTTQELQSLTYNSIVFGHKEHYFASNTPVWDNQLDYEYDAKQAKNSALKKDSKELYIRCVSRLEE